MNERGELNERLARSAAARAHTPGYARTLRPCGAAQARLCGDTPCGAAQAGLGGAGAQRAGAAQGSHTRGSAGARTTAGRRKNERGSGRDSPEKSARKLRERERSRSIAFGRFFMEGIFFYWNGSARPLSNPAAQGTP
jgi:hypothetical protein